ncbi:MAG: InlB B-repeat-containing protein [Clostridiales Family XIII bacterium]|jgi:uncharacterized repeat protein (TIGR02543 family)|nr:InlB B-repeat-containing protein [Clostridiales Family XIII bacterium]
MKRRLTLFVAVIIALALWVGLSLVASAASTTVSISESDTVSTIESNIKNAIDSAGSGNTVTVNGSKTNATSTLHLSIPQGVTVDWKATYKGTTTILIQPSGAGAFKISGGEVSTTSDETNATISVPEGASIAVTVSGGIVSAGVDGSNVNSYAIRTRAGSTVTVSGGTVSAKGNNGYAIIAVDGASITGGTVSAQAGYGIYANGESATVTVSGTGKVQATEANGYAIYTSGNVSVTGGTVSATSGSAIWVMGSVSVTGGTVSATTGKAIYATGANLTVTVSGTGTVEATGAGGYAISTFGNVSVTGGKVKAQAGRAIFAEGASSKVTVSGGEVSVMENGGYAVYASGASAEITISGGSVIATGGNTGYGIYATGSSAKVTVSGGTVSAVGTNGRAVTTNGTGSTVTVNNSGMVIVQGSNGYAIQASGNVEVTGSSAKVNAQTGYCILSNGTNSRIAVSSGEVKATTGIVISASGASAAITVSGTGKVETGDGGYAIWATGESPTVTVSGGTVKATTSYGIYATGTSSTVTVSGTGTVQATAAGGYAIRTNGNVSVEGGTISAQTGRAISAEGASSAVTVSAGTVSNSGTTDANPVIYMSNTGNTGQNVTVSGTGKVQTTGTGGHAIRTSGSVSVSGATSEVSARAGIAIRADAGVSVSGGTVQAAEAGGAAIQTSGNVSVTGGTVKATTGNAIRATGASSAVTVSGGLVFAYGSAITGSNNVVYLSQNSSGFTDASGTGVVVAWNQGAGRTTYIYDAATDISLSPTTGATAVWDRQSSQYGIAYKNGSNEGFIPLNVTLEVEAAISGATISGKTGTALTTQTAAITLAGDTVKNALTNTNAADWFSNVPTGVTVNATAEAGSKTITLSFGGTPTAASDAAFNITIPNTTLTSNTARTVTANSGAKFAILQTYALTVIGGAAMPEKDLYLENEQVTITAGAAPDGQVFDKWTMSGVTLSDATKSPVTFDMPQDAVTVTATYRYATPDAPTVNGEPAATSITLAQVANAQYSIKSIGGTDQGEPQWKDSATFNDLTPNTAYTFVAQIKANGSVLASLPSVASGSIRTAKAALSGTVSISGAQTYGETLAADTDGLEDSAEIIGADKLGVLSYQWKRGEDNIQSATASTYTLTSDDIGQAISVTVTATNCTGSLTAAKTANITQAEPQTIEWPTAAAITYGAELSTSQLDGGGGDGTFAWTDGTIVPTVANNGYEVTFTPSDAENYDYSNVELTRITEIKVNPAAGSFGAPAAINTTYASGMTLADLNDRLASGYAWLAPETALFTGSGQTFAATYTDPSGNYTPTSGDITVNVAKSETDIPPYKADDGRAPEEQDGGGVIVPRIPDEAPRDALIVTDDGHVIPSYTQADEFPKNSEELSAQKDTFPSLALVAKDNTTIYLESKDAGIPFDFSEWIGSWADFFAYSDATYLGRYFIEADENNKPYFTGSDLARLAYGGHELALFAIDGSREAYGAWQHEPPVTSPSSVVVAQGKTQGKTTGETQPQAVKITFDANGGKASGKAKLVKSVKRGEKLGKLKTPTRKNYTFKGWYTKKAGGKKISAGKRAWENVTYYAHWRKEKKARYGKVVNAGAAYVRTYPSLHVNLAPTVGVLEKGRTFKIGGFIDNPGKSDDWYKLKYKGKTRYIFAKYVKVLYE